jgi:hypothetical protein
MNSTLLSPSQSFLTRRWLGHSFTWSTALGQTWHKQWECCAALTLPLAHPTLLQPDVSCGTSAGPGTWVFPTHPHPHPSKAIVALFMLVTLLAENPPLDRSTARTVVPSPGNPSSSKLVAQSTCEVEYYGAGSATKKALWLRKMLKDFGLSVPFIPIFTDNQATLSPQAWCCQPSNKAH